MKKILLTGLFFVLGMIGMANQKVEAAFCQNLYALSKQKQCQSANCVDAAATISRVTVGQDAPYCLIHATINYLPNMTLGSVQGRITNGQWVNLNGGVTQSNPGVGTNFIIMPDYQFTTYDEFQLLGGVAQLFGFASVDCQTNAACIETPVGGGSPAGGGGGSSGSGGGAAGGGGAGAGRPSGGYDLSRAAKIAERLARGGSSSAPRLPPQCQAICDYLKTMTQCPSWMNLADCVSVEVTVTYNNSSPAPGCSLQGITTSSTPNIGAGGKFEGVAYDASQVVLSGVTQPSVNQIAFSYNIATDSSSTIQFTNYSHFQLYDEGSSWIDIYRYRIYFTAVNPANAQTCQ